VGGEARPGGALESYLANVSLCRTAGERGKKEQKGSIGARKKKGVETGGGDQCQIGALLKKKSEESDNAKESWIQLENGGKACQKQDAFRDREQKVKSSTNQDATGAVREEKKGTAKFSSGKKLHSAPEDRKSVSKTSPNPKRNKLM